jgi:hypothetical protein
MKVNIIFFLNCKVVSKVKLFQMFRESWFIFLGSVNSPRKSLEIKVTWSLETSQNHIVKGIASLSRKTESLTTLPNKLYTSCCVNMFFCADPGRTQ